MRTVLFHTTTFLLTTTALLLHSGLSMNAATQTESHSSYRDFKAGEINNLTLSDLGILRLGPELTKIADLDAAVIWASAFDAQGNLYLGTGHKGVVFKVDPQGEVSRLFEPDEILARALAVKPDGTVFVGTSPNGRVYRIEEGKRPEIYFDPPETYIWDLLLDDASGDLYIATGQRARIYRLPADFTPEKIGDVWFQSDHTHITSLAFDHNGDLLAGTAPGAYLHRITAKDTSSVLFNAGASEISKILAAEDAIYFSTFQQRRGSPPPSGRSTPPPPERPTENNEADNSDNENNNRSARQNQQQQQRERARSAARARVPQSALYRLTGDGFAEALWQQPGVHIFSFGRTTDGEWLIGSSSDGEIYQVHDSSTWSLLQKVADGGEISAIVTAADGDHYILTSNPARVYQLSQDIAESGSYTSAVMDSGQVSHWGALHALTYNPLSGEGIQWQTRSGNSPDPDSSWSDWSEPDNNRVTSPYGRYIQYKIDFTSVANGIRQVEVFYRQPNQPPVIQQVNILPVGIEVIPARTAQRASIDINQLIDGPRESNASPQQPRSQLRIVAGPDHIATGWQASDPNDDPLLFRVEMRDLDSPQWLILADEIEDSAYSFNTRGFADGYYQIKITADDRLGNSAETTRTGYRLSDPFLIDNTPPTIRITDQRTVNGHTHVHFEVEDALSRITDLRYTLNGGEPRHIAPDDGLFDDKHKTFTIPLKALTPGAHTLIIEAADASGNTSIHSLSIEISEVLH